MGRCKKEKAAFSVIFNGSITVPSNDIPVALTSWTLTTSEPDLAVPAPTKFNNYGQLNLSTGVWTIVKDGYYDIFIQSMFDVLTLPTPGSVANQAPYLQMLVNGKVFSLNGTGFAGPGPIPVSVLTSAKLKKGDKVTVQVVNPTQFAASLQILASDGLFNSWKADKI